MHSFIIGNIDTVVDLIKKRMDIENEPTCGFCPDAEQTCMTNHRLESIVWLSSSATKNQLRESNRWGILYGIFNAPIDKHTRRGPL